ncbi:hypothetical protein MXD59_09635 [Frankia sp. Ag45/Mut15]|uniref:Uncharacterized protein n=1 Tax=Frankia umida TaxID=573489 RepID=A0ABT0JYD6_9ACTN|nr:hypothetical protein [Frankia umida]MCK9876033.1 hypothetical protein [Frankia umida]
MTEAAGARAGAGTGLGASGHGALGALDRLDDVVVPRARHLVVALRRLLVAGFDPPARRARQVVDRLRVTEGDDGAAGPIVLPGGRGGRIVVLGVVTLIVVSAVAAIVQGARDRAPTLVATGGAGHGRGLPGGSAPAPVPASAPEGGASQGGASEGAAAVPAVRIGPAAQDTVADYLGASRQSLASLTAAAPATDVYAVASLTAAVAPGGLLDVVGGYRIVQVFFTAGISGETEQVTVRDPVADVQAAFAAAASQASERAAADGRAGDAHAQERDDRAAADLRAGCACLFAAVVRAPAGRLTQLAADPRVRVVDPAPPDTAPPTVTFIPLVPDRR